MAKVASGISKIFVCHSNTKPSLDEMREIFSKHGTITGVKLYSKFCFIEYDSEAAAEVAVAAENGSLFKDIKLEVLNAHKRKPKDTVAEASALIKVAVSRSEESPSAAVEKLKQGILVTDVFTKGVSATTAQLNRAHRHKIARSRKRRANKAYKKAFRQSFSPQTPGYYAQSKSQERYVAICPELQIRPEDELSSDHAPRSSSASHSDCDQPLSSYGPITAHPDYEPKSLSTANSRQNSSTIYGWSGWSDLSAEQTYTTAYPHADSQSYFSNYTAECSQVNACRPGTSFYGSNEKTKKDVHSLNQADNSRLTQSVQPWNDAQIIQEGYSKGGYPSGLGKGDRRHLPDLDDYPSVHTVAKSLTSDLKACDPGHVSSLESCEISLAFENAQCDKEYQAQAEMLEDVSNINEAPYLWVELPQLSRAQRHRIAWKNRRRAYKTSEKAVRRSLSPESLEYHLLSKSRERHVSFCSELQTRPEDKLSSDHARCSSSASHSHSDQPLNSYGTIPAYPDYEPKCVPTEHSQRHSSTTYGWSDLSAEQTCTTAYPHADSQSYCSNFAAECSQVNAYRPGTSFYGSQEKTNVHSLKQADNSRLTQSEQPWSDEKMIKEGYSKGGNPSGLAKGERPHLLDLVNYPSVHTVAKSSTSDLKPRKSRDVDYLPAEQTYTTAYPRVDSRSYSSNYTAENSQVNTSRPGTSFYGSHEKTDVRNQESSVESGKISMSRETTSSSQVVSNMAEYQSQEKSDSGIEDSGVCAVIITEPNLKQYGLEVASKIHSIGLKVEICSLWSGVTVIEEVEDASILGLLFAVIIITERDAEHNSVTVNVLHGIPKDHPNMVLDDAVRLIASSYQDYMAAKRADAKSSAVSQLTKSKADEVPDERTQMLITGLAQNQHLTYEELEEIIVYLRKRQEVLRKESNVLGSLSGQSTAPKQQEDSVDVKLQKKLEATIFSILKGESPVQQQATSTKRTHPGSYPPSGHYVDSGEHYVSNDYRRY